MKWEFKEGIPIWTQIIRILEQQIVSGAWPAGSKVPAVRELAMEAGVNPNTMQRALSELERSDLLRSERTTGRFVTEDEETIRTLRTSLGEEMVHDFFINMEQLGFTEDEIIRSVERRIEQ